jgi:gluconolactonase
VSLIVPVEGQKGKYIISVERDLFLLEWDGRSKVRSGFKKLATVDEHQKDNRFNDGKCDNQGRLFIGTMGHESKPGDFALNRGSLFSLDLEGKVRMHEDKISISNGLCWSSDSKKFYFVDSLKYKVHLYDFDVKLYIKIFKIINGILIYY